MAGTRAAQAATKTYTVLAEQVNRIEDGEQLAYRRGETVELTDADAKRLGVDAKYPRDRMVALANADAADPATEPTPGSGTDPASAANGAGGRTPGAGVPVPDDGSGSVPAGADPASSTPGGGAVEADGTPTVAQ